MRFDFVSVSAVMSATLLLAACSSTSEHAASNSTAAQTIETAELKQVAAFCQMIKDANSLSAKARKTIPDNRDCDYFTANGTIAGYSEPSRNQYTGFFQNLRDVSNFSSAMTRSIPPSLDAQDKRAVDTFRKLLVRGFDESVAISMTSRPSFKSAVASAQAVDKLLGRR